MEQIYQHWQSLQDQENPPPPEERRRKCGVTQRQRVDGLSELVLVDEPDRIASILQALDLYATRLAHRAAGEDAAASTGTTPTPPPDAAASTGANPPPDAAASTVTHPVDPDAAASTGAADPTATPDAAASTGAADEVTAEPLDRRLGQQRRGEALGDMIIDALATVLDDDATTALPAAIDVIADYDVLVGRAGLAEVAGGTPLTGDAARRLACDAGFTRIITRGDSQVLDVGRQTRHWNRAQRRAILHRHGHRCAYPGCDRRVVHIHHVIWWDDGGPTDIAHGVPLCYSHHHLMHEGKWNASYDDATGTTTFTGPDGRTTSSHCRRNTARPLQLALAAARPAPADDHAAGDGATFTSCWGPSELDET